MATRRTVVLSRIRKDNLSAPLPLWGAYLAVMLLLGRMYAPSLTQFFWGDDFELVSLLSEARARPSALLRTWGPACRPMTAALNFMEASVFGLNPVPWRAFHMLLHMAGFAALGWLCARLLDSRWAGWAASSLWAVHYFAASTVMHAPLAMSGHPFSFLLYAAALVFFLRWLEKEEMASWIAALGLAVSAMLAKEIAVSWPLAAAGLMWWRMDMPAADFFRRRGLAALVLLAAPPLLWLAVQWIGQGGLPATGYYQFSLSSSLDKTAYVFFRLFGAARYYPGGWAGIVLAAALGAGLFFGYRDRVYRFGLFWALTGFAPVFFVPYFPLHYSYFILPGLCLAGLRLLQSMRERPPFASPGLRRAVLAGAALLFTAYNFWQVRLAEPNYRRIADLNRQTVKAFEPVFAGLDPARPWMFLDLYPVEAVQRLDAKIQASRSMLPIMLYARQDAIAQVVEFRHLVNFHAYPQRKIFQVSANEECSGAECDYILFFNGNFHKVSPEQAVEAVRAFAPPPQRRVTGHLTPLAP